MNNKISEIVCDELVENLAVSEENNKVSFKENLTFPSSSFQKHSSSRQLIQLIKRQYQGINYECNGGERMLFGGATLQSYIVLRFL